MEIQDPAVSGEHPLRRVGKDRGRERERLIGLYLNPTMVFSSLSPAAELISVVLQSTNNTLVDLVFFVGCRGHFTTTVTAGRIS